MKNKDGKEITLEDLEKAIYPDFEPEEAMLDAIVDVLMEEKVGVVDGDVIEDLDGSFIYKIVVENEEDVKKSLTKILATFSHIGQLEYHLVLGEKVIFITFDDEKENEEENLKEKNDWKKELLDEYNKVEDRATSLFDFKYSKEYEEMLDVEKYLVNKQFDALSRYGDFLGYQLDLYGIKHK